VNHTNTPPSPSPPQEADCSLAISDFEKMTSTSHHCALEFSPGGLPFSNCTCAALGPSFKKRGGCSIGGYVYNARTYGSMFAPDFPTSSPWVTSVGATQVMRLGCPACSVCALFRQSQ
jgi:hypothetical protein